MAILGDEDILYAVNQRSRQDAEYRRQLRTAIRRRDEEDVAALIREAVRKILGVAVEVCSDLVRIVLGW
ncbi:hypothetical protein J5X84_21760 [Streptosporangiaceae bacterium NEAU-GS5]|nr:hypothetical protein [Streptosporangiaceae bacterium NEAU-GS5]